MRIKRRSGVLAIALLILTLNTMSSFAAQESNVEIPAVLIEVPYDDTNVSTRSMSGPMGGLPARPEDIALAVEDDDETGRWIAKQEKHVTAMEMLTEILGEPKILPFMKERILSRYGEDLS